MPEKNLIPEYKMWFLKTPYETPIASSTNQVNGNELI